MTTHVLYIQVIQNCSGVVLLQHGQQARHPGMVHRRLFHRAGNVTAHDRGRMFFRAARDPQALRNLLRMVLASECSVRLQLCVLSACIDERVDTNPGSVFERKLGHVPFVRVQMRLMELNTSSMFSVCDFASWNEYAQITEQLPLKTLFVSVTHKGVVTVRVAFHNLEWRTNEHLEQILYKVQALVRFANSAI